MREPSLTAGCQCVPRSRGPRPARFPARAPERFPGPASAGPRLRSLARAPMSRDMVSTMCWNRTLSARLDGVMSDERNESETNCAGSNPSVHFMDRLRQWSLTTSRIFHDAPHLQERQRCREQRISGAGDKSSTWATDVVGRRDGTRRVLSPNCQAVRV